MKISIPLNNDDGSPVLCCQCGSPVIMIFDKEVEASCVRGPHHKTGYELVIEDCSTDEETTQVKFSLKLLDAAGRLLE